MAFIGMVIDKTEAVPDSVEIPKVVLPDGRSLTNYCMGWDNFVYDEIELLVARYEVTGHMDDYELALCALEGIVRILPRKDVVEDHYEELTKYCTIALVPRGTDPETLKHLCPEQNPTVTPEAIKHEVDAPVSTGDSSAPVVPLTK